MNYSKLLEKLKEELFKERNTMCVRELSQKAARRFRFKKDYTVALISDLKKLNLVDNKVKGVIRVNRRPYIRVFTK